MGGIHSRATGVDFGTSTSLVAHRAGRRPVEIAPLGQITKSFPSVAGFRGDALVVGEAADALNTRVIRSVKRAITESRTTVVVPGPGGPRTVDADEVITAVLTEIGNRAASADQALTSEHDLRLGCPAMWDGAQRERLLGLAVKAGLPVEASSLVDEPIAAGVAWVAHRFLAYGERPQGRLLVFDMGGGTLDIAVLDVVGGPHPEISVLSALGISTAGDALDQAIVNDLRNDLAEHGVHLQSLADPDLAEAHLLRAARAAKVRLSRTHSLPVHLPGEFGSLPTLSYNRERLEEAFRPQLDQAAQLVWAAVRAARLSERGSRSPVELRAVSPEALAGDIGYVLLAGGMSRIPYLERRIGELFPHAQVFDNAGVDPDEAIVAGLADTAGYERLNLHRPGFDFVLEWRDGRQTRQEILYPAHTPFYEPWQVFNGQSDLGYALNGRSMPGPSFGDAVLRVRSTSGDYLGITYEGQTMDGLRLRFGTGLRTFKLYCDGRVLIRPGDGSELYLRVDRWPVVRGRDHARLVFSRANPTVPVQPTAWYLEKEWAPPAFAQQAPRR